MDPITILALIEKAVTVVSMAIAAGKAAGPALQVIKDLASGGQAGTVTDAQLAETEALLDAQIEEFNKPME